MDEFIKELMFYAEQRFCAPMYGEVYMLIRNLQEWTCLKL